MARLHPHFPAVVRRIVHPRRFRDRLLAGMLLVALLPLAIFGALVAADLGHISSQTTAEAHRAIIDDQEARQQSSVTDRARLLDTRLTAIGDEVRHLRDQMAVAVSTPPRQVPYPALFSDYSGIAYTSGADTTIIVGQSARQVAGPAPASPAVRAAALATQSQPLVPMMQALRHADPEVEAVWVVDKVDAVIRTVPSMDVPSAVDNHRLDSAAPLGPDGETIFSTSQKRFSSAGDDPENWADPNRTGPQRPADGPFWTDPYQTRQAGEEGVTVWVPVGDGRTLVGADITVQQLANALVQSPISGEPGAYPLLLSSSNKVLGGGPEVRSDFHMSNAYVGAMLPSSGHRDVDSALSGIEKTGHAHAVRVTLQGTDRELFTAPIYGPHWVLATSVPVADLEPDATALGHGIDTAIHRLLLLAVPLAVVVCGLAFAVATVFARHLVGPVGALTTSAERLAQGHIDEPVPPQGDDEVGLLADSLERMRREVNGSRDAILAAAHELEGRVAERTAELRSRNDELVALNALAGSLTRSLEPSVILEGGLTALAAVLPVDAGLGFAGDANHLRELTRLGDDPTPHAEALRTIAAAALDEGMMATRLVAAGVLVGLPLRTSDGQLGALAVLAGSATAVRRRETLLGAVADQVGLALRTAHLSAQRRALAVLEERTRLAREIHDTLAQQLTAIVLQLEAAEPLVGRSQRRAREVVVTARDQARHALAEARRSVWDLRPAPLTATGLVAALDAEVERWRNRTGIDAALLAHDLPTPLTLQPQAEVALLRIAQEALANAAYHSGANRVVVTLNAREGLLELRVQDDGNGFAIGTGGRPDSFGLTGMDERARLIGGRLDVDSVSGQGTRVSVRVPIGDLGGVPA